MSELMSEGTVPESFKDPRTELAGTFRGFLIKAIRQQEIQDDDTFADGTERSPAGSLYKVDGGLLKVLLAETAEDEVLYDPHYKPNTRRFRRSKPPLPLPILWVSVLIPPEAYEVVPEADGEDDEDIKPSQLEVIDFSAEDLFVRKVFRNGKVEKMVSGNAKYIPDFDTLEELLEYAPPDDVEQMLSAIRDLEMLANYDIRTIRSTQNKNA